MVAIDWPADPWLLNGKKRRGQIGVGTIIVLIAVLLVAATTAGVLVNVTGLLQSEAGAAGQSVGAEVESPVRVAAVTGRANQSASPPVLERTRVTLALDGATSVDLDDATVRLETPNGPSTLVYDADGPQQGTSFGIDAVADPDNSSPALSDSADRLAIVLDTPDLVVGDQVMIRVSLETGASETIRFRVPARIESADAVTLD